MGGLPGTHRAGPVVLAPGPAHSSEMTYGLQGQEEEGRREGPVRARLVAKPDPNGQLVPVYALAPGNPMPDGAEEVELESRPDHTDCCACGHPRSHHTSYQKKCLKLHCKCPRFQEAA